MLYEASHDNIEKFSDQAWNHIADTKIKAFLRGFCFGLLCIFVSLCCPGCLFPLVITLKWQFWRGDGASVVLSPLQNMLELMCTHSSLNGEGETLPAHRKPGRAPIKLPGTWDSKPPWSQREGFWNTAPCSPYVKEGDWKSVLFCMSWALQHKVLLVAAWMGVGYDSLTWLPLSDQWGCFPGSAPYYLSNGDIKSLSWGLCMSG